MNAQPVYLICAAREDGERYKAAAAAVLHRHGPAVVVTEVAELRRVPDGFAFHIVTPPPIELWAYVAEHGGADIAPATFEGAGP